MILPPGPRKLALTLHVTSSVGWLGAVLAFLALAVAALTSRDADVARAGGIAMNLTTRFVIVPLAFASLLTGLLSSLGTHWGLVRHYWVLVKFLLIVVATAVLLLQVGPIGALADAATGTGPADVGLREARASAVVHAAGGLLVLLGATVLAIYKPRGMTRHGWRHQPDRPRPTSPR
ncbi:DUF2269 domain-containing protein [Micromonospora phytophila]|uniref:DUF2269 domain-containing protein n=1 Tax=Micromonospora phytophila TaxID=709888 RepID=UPI00202F33CD|nr:DUF2269 domain-containing protein [Micromonospora phytophila]MCM0675308.1 DUF2269 domain-containing protein [Micromonospora phytophila]